MNLPVIDTQSQTWINLKEHFEARLQELRERNDSSASIEETEKIRGQITEIKMFLSIEKELEKRKEDRNHATRE